MSMPDVLLIFSKRWKLIAAITFAAVLIALLVVLIVPKKYLAVATALPANSLIADKARIFNQNIFELYSDFGTVDELDKLEGTGKLDTLFIAAAEEFKLDEHYKIPSSDESLYDAVVKLKKECRISRSGYGELQVRVWDTDKHLCAQLANFIMKRIQEIHQHLQNESNTLIIARLKEAYALKQKSYTQMLDSGTILNQITKARLSMLSDEIVSYGKMIDEYQLAISTNAPVLLIVENARPALWADRPKITETVLFAFFGAFIFSFLLALFIESRTTKV